MCRLTRWNLLPLLPSLTCPGIHISGSVTLELEHAPKLPGVGREVGLCIYEHRLLGLIPWISNSVDLEWNMRMLISSSSFFCTFFLIKKLIYFNFRLITLQFCGVFWHESAVGAPVSPILNLPPTSLPTPSLWVIPVHQPWAPCLMHWTWTGDLFHIW